METLCLYMQRGKLVDLCQHLGKFSNFADWNQCHKTLLQLYVFVFVPYKLILCNAAYHIAVNILCSIILKFSLNRHSWYFCPWMISIGKVPQCDSFHGWVFQILLLIGFVYTTFCIMLICLQTKLGRYMWLLVSVCAVCICLCTGYLKKLVIDVKKIMWKGWPWAKEEVIKFWYWSRYGSRISCFTFQHCKRGNFSTYRNVWH